MVDSIPVDILNGGSIFIFQNADISILSEMLYGGQYICGYT
jgi:hypothetical protein